MFGYRVPSPDEALLIAGGRGKKDGTPFRVVTGHGAFVLPFARQATFLTLAMREAEVAEQCVTKQGIALSVKAVIAFKVGNDPESIVNAAQRFLSDQDQMSVLAGRIFAGHLRSIVGSMTVEEIVTERQKLATEVLDGSKAEMVKMGLIVDSLQIQSIDDMGAGYIAAMAAPHNAAIQRQAKIAQARGRPGGGDGHSRSRPASRPSTSARRRSSRPSTRPTSTRPRPRPASPGRLARRPTRQREVIKAQHRAGRARGPALRQQQLVAEVIKPAEAEAERTRVTAEAEANRIKIQAEAAASHNRVALDRMLIDQLPLIVREAAAGLASADITVLNGADGLGEIAAGLVSQGLSIFDTVKRNMAPVDGPAGDRGGDRGTEAGNEQRQRQRRR